MTVGPSPLIALCALSSGTPRLSRNLTPAHLAGLGVDPTVEAQETVTSVQTGQLSTFTWALLDGRRENDTVFIR